LKEGCDIWLIKSALKKEKWKILMKEKIRREKICTKYE
jgi:hypothetical protein